MDVTFIANDTRGGVEPYLALAAEVVARGHTARAAAPQSYESAFTAVGARFAPLRGIDQSDITAHQDAPSLREMGRRVTELAAVWASDTQEFAEGTDLVVSGIGGMAVARPVAEAVGAGLLRAHLQPLDAPSAAYPGPLAPQLSALGAMGNRLSHPITQLAVGMLTRGPERAARRALGLSTKPIPVMATILYGFSRAAVPVTSDARTTRIATGWWTPRVSSIVDDELRAFVQRPGPVVSIGFGSMTTGDPQALRALVADAVRRVGVRAVVLTGWGALGAVSAEDADVFGAASAPHSWLFPRMAATVHHGGAGTTGAALTAGKPTVVVPFGADQPFWAFRAQRLGVAPSPIARRRLTADRLARAIESALSDAGMQERAGALGERLRREDGVRAAVDAIETAIEVGA